MTGVHDTIGRDLVNHCVNDILVQGASRCSFSTTSPPAGSSPDVAVQIVEGLADGVPRERLRAARRRDRGDARLLRRRRIRCRRLHRRHRRSRTGDRRPEHRAGDVLIGIPSSGLHTNGYSLARRIVFDAGRVWRRRRVPELGVHVGDALLVPHRSYLRLDRAAARRGRHQGHGAHHRRRHHRQPAAHPAGRPPRVIERRRVADAAALPVAAADGDVPDDDMLRTFNMGIGLIVRRARREDSSACRSTSRAGERWRVVIGRIADGGAACLRMSDRSRGPPGAAGSACSSPAAAGIFRR